MKNTILSSNFRLEVFIFILIYETFLIFTGKLEGQFEHPVVHEFAFLLNLINYIDFPVGNYVTCSHN